MPDIDWTIEVKQSVWCRQEKKFSVNHKVVTGVV